MPRAVGPSPAPQAAPRETALPPTERAARDLRLVQAYLRGEREAFDDLVRAYERPVARLLSQLAVPSAEVEDLEQEVFLRVFRKLPAFRGTASFYAWLYRITLNVVFDDEKKRRRAAYRLQLLQVTLSDPSSTRSERFDPYLAYCEGLAATSLAEAIARLPAAFREVFALREVDDLTCEDIAYRTGIAGGTVRSRLSRARALLRDTLAPAMAGAAA